MAGNRLVNWFATDAGKKFSYFAAGGISSVVLISHVIPHTVLLSKYEDIVRLYKKGFSVPLSKKLSDRFQKALELCEIKNIDRELYKPFPVYGFDVFSAGYCRSKYGVIIGLPANFSYEDEKTVDTVSIKLRDDSIPWETDEGKLLVKSLVLSENAQLYGMAREIKYRQTPKFIIDTLVSTFSVMGIYGLANTLNTRLNLFAKPLGLRIVLYVIVTAFAGGSYVLCKDASQVYYEEKIDRELKEKNPIFVEGGKEFYEKILQRNIALRKLLGKEGERSYSVLGNENYFIRYKHIPLVQRKQIFES